MKNFKLYYILTILFVLCVATTKVFADESYPSVCGATYKFTTHQQVNYTLEFDKNMYGGGGCTGVVRLFINNAYMESYTFKQEVGSPIIVIYSFGDLYQDSWGNIYPIIIYDNIKFYRIN